MDLIAIDDLFSLPEDGELGEFDLLQAHVSAATDGSHLPTNPTSIEQGATAHTDHSLAPTTSSFEKILMMPSSLPPIHIHVLCKPV